MADAAALANQPPGSPSPPPSAPLSTEPGPRAQNLNKVFTGALQHTVSTCSYAHFASCFPTAACYNKPLLESVWRQVQSMIESRSRREFEEILVEKDVIKGLNELDRLVVDANGRRERKEGPLSLRLHELAPQSLFFAHLAPYLQETQTKLDARLGDMQIENAALVRTLQSQEEEMEMILSRLETAVADLQTTNHELQDNLANGEVRKEAKELNAEVAGGRNGKESRL